MSLCTDDTGLFSTTLSNEYYKAALSFGRFLLLDRHISFTIRTDGFIPVVDGNSLIPAVNFFLDDMDKAQCPCRITLPMEFWTLWSRPARGGTRKFLLGGVWNVKCIICGNWDLNPSLHNYKVEILTTKSYKYTFSILWGRLNHLKTSKKLKFN